MKQSASDLLLQMAADILEHTDQGAKGTWRWKDGLKIAINPSAMCPNCKEWVPTKNVWIIDDLHQSVVGRWRLIDGKPTSYERDECHPHVSGVFNGTICMGGGKIASEVLFTSMAPGVHYHSTERYLFSIGHRCKKISLIKCTFCGIDHPGRSPYYYGRNMKLCSRECYNTAVLTRCGRCEAVKDLFSPMEWGTCCEQCYIETTALCRYCGGREFRTFMVTVNGEPSCSSCLDEYCRRCIYCECWKPKEDFSPTRVCGSCRLSGDDEPDDEEEGEEPEEEEENPVTLCCYCEENEVQEDLDHCENCCSLNRCGEG